MSYCTFQRLNEGPITSIIDENSLTCCNYQLRPVWIEAQIIYAAIQSKTIFNEQKYWQTFMLSNITVNFVVSLTTVPPCPDHGLCQPTPAQSSSLAATSNKFLIQHIGMFEFVFVVKATITYVMLAIFSPDVMLGSVL
jgi:hypothetical protein